MFSLRKERENWADFLNMDKTFVIYKSFVIQSRFSNYLNFAQVQRRDGLQTHTYFWKQSDYFFSYFFSERYSKTELTSTTLKKIVN